MNESIGAIRVPGMIWTSTLLTLGSLAICWLTTSVPNPTILQSAVVYPYTIIFRIGMMYSLFITFLELLFIKWWLDSLPSSKHTTLMVVSGSIGLAAYGLFVSCIDRKRINYLLAGNSVFVAALSTSLTIFLIMSNLRKNRKGGIGLSSQRSWFLKKLFSWIHFIGMSLGVLIYLGELDLLYKPLVEYMTVVSTVLFFGSFSLDFVGFKMDVQRVQSGLIIAA